MKKIFVLIVSGILFICSCTAPKPIEKITEESLSFCVEQYSFMADVMRDKSDLLPQTLDTAGNLVLGKANGWTSGFFPGSLWYLYEFTGDAEIKEDAKLITSRIEDQKYNTSTHDLGFMLYCSFGNGLRLTGEESYNEVLLTGARSLCTRFRPEIGMIQSWNSRRGWQCPVIIDNMMNLELLMWAFKKSGDSTFYKIAVSHADSTMKHHFRADNSTFHVVSFDTVTAKVEAKQTGQGAADESAWARGQSWGLYGYTVMYRETGLDRYLNRAVKIADFLISHPNLPEDKIPYWDYDAPGIPDAERDASAGAIMASALIELSGYVDEKIRSEYLDVAETQLRSLSSPSFRAKPGTNGNFILMHSVGSLPDNSQVDVPLPYADYYYIEALMRYRKLAD